jgi:predicted amidohydrolase
MAPVTFTLIQTALHWEDKAANLQQLEQKLHALPQSAQVVVLPEMFSTGFSMNAERLPKPWTALRLAG